MRRRTPRFPTTFCGPARLETTLQLAREAARSRDRLLVVRSCERLRAVLSRFPWMQGRVWIHAELNERNPADGPWTELLVDEADLLGEDMLDRLRALTKPVLVMHSTGARPRQEPTT